MAKVPSLRSAVKKTRKSDGMRKSRGLAPEDSRFFDKENLARLKKAVADLSWLLQRGYSQKAATELVGNRYQLTRRERHALIHAAWGHEKRRPPLAPDALLGNASASTASISSSPSKQPWAAAS